MDILTNNCQFKGGKKYGNDDNTGSVMRSRLLACSW